MRAHTLGDFSYQTSLSDVQVKRGKHESLVEVSWEYIYSDDVEKQNEIR